MMRGNFGVLAIAVAAAIATGTGAAAAQTAVPVPAWFQAELKGLVTGDSTRWRADNQPWKTAQEPFDSYGQRYWPVMGGTAIRGVLFGIQDGKESRPFIEFRVFWHPEGRAIIQQWDAWGGFAEGVLRAPVNGVSRLEQVAWGADGSSRRTAHDTSWENGTHVGIQFSWENGAWAQGRRYVWSRESTPQ